MPGVISMDHDGVLVGEGATLLEVERDRNRVCEKNCGVMIRDEARFVATLKTADPGVMALRRFCDWIAVRMVSYPAAFSLLGLIAVSSLGVSASLGA